MSFTSETSAQARNKKDQKKKDKIEYDEKKSLKAQNGHILAMYHQLKIKFIEYVRCTIDPRIWEKTMKYCQEKFSILYVHISNIRVTKRSNGNKYDDEKLRQFFILISFFGRSLIEFLKSAFAFPCWKTIMNWKKDHLKEYNIKLNGSIDSIAQLKEKFYGVKMDDNRVVVAIDAVSVSPNITVDINGCVSGLIELDSLPAEEASFIINSPEKFAHFIEQNIEKVIKYFFVLYICPLNPQYLSIPICIIPRSNGNANSSVIQVFDEVIVNLSKSGMNIIGKSYDGDTSLLSRVFLLAKNLCDNTLNHPEYTLEELAHYSKKVSLGRLIFEDFLHLVKCNRYRLASGALFCPSLYSAEATISRSAYEDNGIPQWIMNNNRFTKMDDAIPFKFFTIKNILHLRQKQKYDLGFALFPSTLLIESVMNESYLREQRLHLLSLGYSIIFIYYKELEEYTKNPQKTSKSKGKGRCATLFEKKILSKIPDAIFSFG